MRPTSHHLPAWLGSPFVVLSLAPLFWATNWIVGRGVASDVPPMAMAFYRWLFALCILAPFAWPHVVRDWQAIKKHYRVLASSCTDSTWPGSR